MPIPATNLFLSKLSPTVRDTLLRRASAVELPVGTALYDGSAPPRYAHFLLSGLASVVTPMPNGDAAEIGMIGREGVVGAVHLLGDTPLGTLCFMQLDGNGLRIPFGDFHTSFENSTELRTHLLHFVQQEITMVAQIAGCNRLHEAEQRLARWLLMSQDRTGYETLKFTQEYLSQMLGTQRTTVTLIAGQLQQRGLIQHSRGAIHIVDRSGLEAAACPCYAVIRRAYATAHISVTPNSAHHPQGPSAPHGSSQSAPVE